MAQGTKHTSESLAAMDKASLRAEARRFKVNIAALSPKAIIRAILKRQANAAGKGTAADPHSSGKRGLGDKAKTHIEIPDEDIKMPKKKTTKTSKPAAAKSSKNPLKGLSQDDVNLLFAELLVGLARVTDVPIPEKLQALGKSAVAEPDEDEEEGDDEEDDEEEEVDEDESDDDEDSEDDDDEEPDEDDDEEVDSDESDDDDEEEDDEEDGEDEKGPYTDLKIDVSAIPAATLEDLQRIAKKINKAAKTERVDPTLTNRKALRRLIIEELNKHKVDVVEDDDEPKKGTGAPGWLKKKARVQAKFDGTWFKGTVISVGKKNVTVLTDKDDQEADYPFSLVRPLSSAKKTG